MSVRKSDFYTVSRAELERLYRIVPQKYYPPRVPPKQWPSLELIGKAMARGWAIPCRYYPRMLRGGYQRTFVYPGISNAEMMAIHIIMRKEKKC